MIHKMIIITLMIAYFGVVRCDVNETEEFENYDEFVKRTHFLKTADFVKRAEKKFSEDDIVELSNDLANIYQGQADSYFDDYIKPNLTFLTDDKIVRVKNFLQTFFEVESRIGRREICEGDCEDYQNVEHNKDGCSGTVKNCYKDEGRTVTLQDPQEDRIYTNVAHESSCPWCRGEFTYSGNQIKMVPWITFFAHCSVCLCTCDQHSFEKTTRRFYLNAIEAPPGYVVTGTRFVEHNRTIFLQIQVGKMVTLGLIDQDSVKWQDLPNDIEDDQYFSLTYDEDSVILNADMCAEIHGVVTGFYFERHEYGAILRTIRTQITDPLLGSLAKYPLTCRESHGIDKSLLMSFSGKIPNVQKNIPMEWGTGIVTKPLGVRFGMSSFKHDLGQSCVPYFDGSDVTLTVKFPLSRIDFVHYTNNEDYAGFIRPVLIPLK